MRKKILRALYQAKGYISGELISKRLGISRVAVWKHIQALKREGYIIDASPKGYKLISSPDLLLPDEFIGLRQKVYYLKEVSSTMDVAKKLAKRGEEAIVIAETQTSGRGRLGRRWHSQKGGIYFTIILRPRIGPAHAQIINLMAAVSVARAIRSLFNLEAKLKWPNDVLIRGKKVCGILAEMEAEMDVIKFVNLGIGINANNPISLYEEGATSIKEELGRDISRKELLMCVLNEIEKRRSLLGKEIISEWKALSSTINKKVRIIMQDEVVEGEAIDIDTDGALILRTDKGIRRIIAGDCIHLK